MLDARGQAVKPVKDTLVLARAADLFFFAFGSGDKRDKKRMVFLARAEETYRQSNMSKYTLGPRRGKKECDGKRT